MVRPSNHKALRFASNILIVLGFALFGLGLFVTVRSNFITVPSNLAHVPGQAPPIAYARSYPTETPYATPTPIPVSTESVPLKVSALTGGLSSTDEVEVPSPTAIPPKETATPMPPTPTATRVIPSPTPVVYEEPERIKIPALDIDSKVLEVGWKTFQQGSQFISEWETADYAVGYHKFSALPSMEGNMVMSGHNNIRGSIFRNLADIPLGSEITVYTANHTYYYRVEDKFIIKEAGVSEEEHQKNAQWIAPTTDERLTLVSCWPVWTNTHRIIVIAKRILAPTPSKRGREPDQ
ncbi:MAG: sortase [Chloroflexi bacterium]|nr:sortase [Chloroflexota bacterium]